MAGAVVELEDEVDGEHSYQATTDAEGGFRIASVADGRYQLRASKIGLAPAELDGGLEVAGAAVEDVELRLLAGAMIEGELLGLSFEEVAQVRVEARQRGGRRHRGTVAHEGGYRVTDLSPGDWQVQVRAWLEGGSRQAQERVVVEPDVGRVWRDLEFGQGVALDGQVLHRSQPLDGTKVRLRGFDIAVDRSVVTDLDGRFRMADLKSGSYRLELADSRRRLVHNQDLALHQDTELTIEIATASLSGTVVSAASGEGLGNALILLKQLLGGQTEEGSLFSVGSEAEGSFRFDSLTAGSYRLTVQRDGFQPIEQTLELAAGAGYDGLRLELEATEGLDVAARLGNGTVPRTLTIAAFDGGGRQIFSETRVLVPDDYTRFATLPPGSWSLLASAPGGATLRTTVEIPGEPLELILPTAGRLRVRVAELAETDRVATLSVGSQDGLPFRHLEANGQMRDAWPIVGGYATVEGLPPGLWALRAVTPDGVIWTGSAITTGGPDIEVQLE